MIKMIYIKIHQADEGNIIAACDESLIEQILEEGEIYIDIKEYPEFYKGDLVDPEKYDLDVSLKELNSANIVGKESVDYMVRKGLIDEENIKYVNGIPYAHSYVIKDEKK